MVKSFHIASANRSPGVRDTRSPVSKRDIGRVRLHERPRATRSTICQRKSSRMSHHPPCACRYPAFAVGVVLVMALLTSGCMFQTVREQQAKAAALCTISGTVPTERGRPHVGLLRQSGGMSPLSSTSAWWIICRRGGTLWFFRVSLAPTVSRRLPTRNGPHLSAGRTVPAGGPAAAARLCQRGGDAGHRARHRRKAGRASLATSTSPRCKRARCTTN